MVIKPTDEIYKMLKCLVDSETLCFWFVDCTCTILHIAQCTIYIIWYLLMYLSSYVDRRQLSIFAVFDSSCHLLLPVQSLKGRGNPLNVLPKDTIREIAAYFYSSL